jgi:hypothetical protein
MSPGPEDRSTEEPTEVRIPVFGARKKARELADRNRELETALEKLGAMETLELERQQASLRAENEQLANQTEAMALELGRLRSQVVVTEEQLVLQEVGLYEYRHPLDDAVAYQAQLKALKDQLRTMAKKDGGAVLAATDWTVNGSLPQGRKMVRETSKLVLRAYNAEADNLVRSMKPYKLDSSIDRLNKVVLTIAKLGKTMNIEISREYHSLRVLELELTADFINRKAEEKERAKEEKARLREEQKVQQEIERERARLQKERTHHLNALAKLQAQGDLEAAARIEAEIADLDRAIEEVDYRAANIRAGYVYVISNLGSFGEGIIKVGLTRRLEPMDRVRELGDASVPFRYDIHALFFSEDAVGVERELHSRLADRRVNLVNHRREFFYATPHDVKEHLKEVAGDILEYEEVPEALEFRQSLAQAKTGADQLRRGAETLI